MFGIPIHVMFRIWYFNSCMHLFFTGLRVKNHLYDEFRTRCAKCERKTVSDFYWLKTPPACSIALGARYIRTVSRLNGSHGPGRKLAQRRAPPSLLTTA